MITIQITMGQVAVVDDIDADLATRPWHAQKARYSNTFYAVRNTRNVDGTWTTQGLHQVIAIRMGIAGAPDHADGHGLNNRRSNLRPASASQQGANRQRQCNNTSGFKGVTWHKACGKWQAQVMINRKTRFLGLHAAAVGAALAHDRAALEAFGEFAVLNFRVDPRTEALVAGSFKEKP